MSLYPLCRHRTSPAEAVTHAALAIRGHESDSVTRANLLTTLAIFGRLVPSGINVLELIGREHMKESPMYAEIMMEGEIKARQADILEAIQLRFGPKAAAEFEPRLRPVNDLDALSRLHRLAIQSRRLTEFRRGFAAEIARK